MNTSIARYALGAAALLVVVGGIALAAVAIRRRTLPDWLGAPARLAEAVIGLALLIAILEVLGTVGLFELGPIVIACGLAGVAGIRQLTGTRVVRHRHEQPGTGLLIGVALVAGAVVIAEWGALTIQSYNVGIRGFDSLWYHLPWAASFAQTGNITALRFTDVEYLTPFYPATAEMLHGLGIVLLGRDTLSPGLNLPWLALTLLAGYCIGRPRGVGAATTIGAALAMGTTMMDYSQAGAAANDVVALFFLLAAVALLNTEPELRAARVLAAIAAGLAVGTKLTVLAPVLALTVGVIAIAPRGRRTPTAGLWLGPLIVAGGFWYARNLIAVGNPLPWTSFAGVLPTPAPPLQQHTGYSVAHYLTSSHFWSAFAQPALAAGLGRWWWAVLGIAIIGPLLCLAGRRTDRVTRMLGAAALFSLAAYLVTPETAAGTNGNPAGFAFNLRYLAPALTLSLAVAPLAPALAGPRARTGTVAVLAVVLAGTVAEPRLWPSTHTAGAIVIGAAALAALGLLALGRRSRAAIVVAIAAVVAIAIAGYPLQRHYLRGRYAYQPNVSYLARAWALFRTVHDSKVGVVGTFGGFFSYPFYGLDLSNRVTYVAQRGPHGSFTPIATCARWRAQVNSDHLTYLITTPARDPWNPTVLSPSPETRWTATDPAATPVFTENALGQPIVVFRLRGALDPAGCPQS
ncbi:MAG TPA: hypothetical protein VMB27_12140 [Solirubrobacteraceae bacterium]|nr:hypothetical protein [Solirubrobacteraceae bacterium]